MTTPLSISTDVVCLAGSIEELESVPLRDVERADLGAVSEKRRREFAAGRAIARMAMRACGLAAADIPKGSDRLPQWPPGVIGSISHTDTLVAAAIATRSMISGMGLDIERLGSVDENTYSMIMLDAEAAEMQEQNIDVTTLFSAKESLFKAVYPLEREYFDFLDVQIRFAGRSFSVLPLTAPSRSAERLVNGNGRLVTHEGHVVTLFVI